MKCRKAMFKNLTSFTLLLGVALISANKNTEECSKLCADIKLKKNVDLTICKSTQNIAPRPAVYKACLTGKIYKNNLNFYCSMHIHEKLMVSIQKGARLGFSDACLPLCKGSIPKAVSSIACSRKRYTGLTEINCQRGYTGAFESGTTFIMESINDTPFQQSKSEQISNLPLSPSYENVQVNNQNNLAGPTMKSFNKSQQETQDIKLSLVNEEQVTFDQPHTKSNFESNMSDDDEDKAIDDTKIQDKGIIFEDKKASPDPIVTKSNVGSAKLEANVDQSKKSRSKIYSSERNEILQSIEDVNTPPKSKVANHVTSSAGLPARASETKRGTANVQTSLPPEDKARPSSVQESRKVPQQSTTAKKIQEQHYLVESEPNIQTLSHEDRIIIDGVNPNPDHFKQDNEYKLFSTTSHRETEAYALDGRASDNESKSQINQAQHHISQDNRVEF